MLNPTGGLLKLADSLGIQETYLFLGMALTSAPLFFIAAAVSDPRVLVSLKKTQDRAFALSVSKAPWLDITCEEPCTWKMVSPAFDRRFEKYKAPLFKDAYGVVIDIGSGTGDNLRYLQADKITKLYLIEPNHAMWGKLEANLAKYGFTKDKYQIVQCGAQEKDKIEQLTGLTHNSVDCVTSILALCGIPDSEKVIACLYDYLKPGGTFMFFEHVASTVPKVKTKQDKLTPLWRNLFDGCHLNRPTDKYIIDNFAWQDHHVGKVDSEPAEYMDPKAWGWAKKASA